MAPNGGFCFFILIMTSAALAQPPDLTVDDKTVKKLMMKCQSKGFPLPPMSLLNSVFNSSDLIAVDRSAEQSSTILSSFLQVLNSVTPGRKNDPMSQLAQMNEKMTHRMLNCSHLSFMIQKIRNSSDSSSCFLKAFVAPLSWTALITQRASSIDPDSYNALLWAARPVLEDEPSETMKLPTKVEGQNMKSMMNMLREVYKSMTDIQRSRVLNWAKDQILENNFNCTTRPPTDPQASLMLYCKPSLQWLDSESLSIMGPYISQLMPEDIDFCPKHKLCEFFLSAQLRSSMYGAAEMGPSLSKKFLQRIQECFSENEFQHHVDKLGPLACYYDAPDLTSDLCQRLLSQLSNCNYTLNPMLRKHLVNCMMSNSSDSEALLHLGSGVTMLSPEQLSALPATNLSNVLQRLGFDLRWTTGQLLTIVRNQLGDKKCEEVSGKELLALQSVAAGLPTCALKNDKVEEILTDREALKNMSQQMRKGQLKAMLQGLLGKMNPSELVQKLPGPLLRSISLSNLNKANITSLEQVQNKTWSRSQAAYLAQKMFKLKQLQFQRLNSVLQGVTCEMIDNVSDSSVMEMAQAITKTPQWLSKVQARCAAQKLFLTLEKERSDYFKTITEQELDVIPTMLLLHLPPWNVKDLPDSTCRAFLDKMQTANLSSLPLHAPSRPAITQRALLCLSNGRNLSELTIADVSRLGQLLCEVKPSQIQQMAPDVIKFSLRTMAFCFHIAQLHRPDLIQMVNQTFGNPSDWSEKTMECLGPLLLLDDNTTSFLPNKPWMKDVLVFLRSRLHFTSDVLQKKLFDLTTSPSSAARRKRGIAGSGSGSAVNAIDPSEKLIEELGMNNVYWTAPKLETMSNSTFLAAVETLGAIPGYSADQLQVLSHKGVQAFGPVTQMTERDVARLGCITRGFSDSNLEKLPFSLDILEGIAHCGWNNSQMTSVWKSVAKYNNLTVHRMGAAEMVALNRFICGLNSSEIRQLSVDAFRDAVGSIDAVQCSSNMKKLLKNLTVSAFGNPSTWTEARVSDLHSIIAGLDAAEMASLKPSVFAFLTESCVPHIPPENLAALSVAQLEALGPDNAALLTSGQRAVLSGDQLAAVQRAATGSTAPPQNSAQSDSGAPALMGDGFCLLVKPLLLLITGVLLL
ncbi:Otoancorin [Oryzias melastigma]|uniref:Otoancorin n=2 Tax=Oryzias melastigma TaxID=30732 RepID=A0A3B3D5D2_ORYME|nr:otoancorin isoform X2 [Oryzias melastigma]KAF6739596.1 Otoancorin [Oryzias melastigma]